MLLPGFISCLAFLLYFLSVSSISYSIVHVSFLKIVTLFLYLLICFFFKIFFLLCRNYIFFHFLLIFFKSLLFFGHFSHIPISFSLFIVVLFLIFNFLESFHLFLFSTVSLTFFPLLTIFPIL